MLLAKNHTLTQSKWERKKIGVIYSAFSQFFTFPSPCSLILIRNRPLIYFMAVATSVLLLYTLSVLFRLRYCTGIA